jgi:hypothetical protein
MLYHYTECRNLIIFMLNVFMLNAIILNVIMLNATVLRVIMLNVIMLSVVAPLKLSVPSQNIFWHKIGQNISIVKAKMKFISAGFHIRQTKKNSLYFWCLPLPSPGKLLLLLLLLPWANVPTYK